MWGSCERLRAHMLSLAPVFLVYLVAIGDGTCLSDWTKIACNAFHLRNQYNDKIRSQILLTRALSTGHSLSVSSFLALCLSHTHKHARTCTHTFFLSLVLPPPPRPPPLYRFFPLTFSFSHFCIISFTYCLCRRRDWFWWNKKAKRKLLSKKDGKVGLFALYL